VRTGGSAAHALQSTWFVARAEAFDRWVGRIGERRREVAKDAERQASAEAREDEVTAAHPVGAGALGCTARAMSRGRAIHALRETGWRIDGPNGAVTIRSGSTLESAP
jgi:hypothetical protein